jgi:ParB family transcriptional regulator, chromosome partitioning protein
MQLLNIEIGKLSISPLNMRYGKKAPDVSDILPSIRARGVLVPLLVRPAAKIGDFEIVAGSRRYHAAQIVGQETGESESLPCAVMGAGDDAAALEASLIENVARLDPDEVSQWETYTRLIQKEGRTADQIAQTFGITELMVRRVLALGNLLPRIRDLYRGEDINAATVRHLTMASKTQQKEWLALHNNPNDHAPTGQQLKAWLFGGTSISSKVALFDLADFKGQIITDLFGEDGYFADPDAFWEAQSQAVAVKRDALLEDGWSDVEILETGQHFASWEYQKTSKKDGGKVFVSVSHRGEVEFHQGFLSAKDAKRKQAKAANTQGGNEDKNASRPEVSTTLQTYIDLHRHAAARAVLTDHPGVALRLMLAHAINGSRLWSVKVEEQNGRSEAITTSVQRSAAEHRFDEKWQAVIALLDVSPDDITVAGGNGDDYQTTLLFARLLNLSDAEVLSILAVVMGETLLAGSAAVEAVGSYLKVDMKALWAPDEAFFDLMRDRQVVNAVLRDIGGKRVADGNVAEKLKTQKAIIRDYVDGTNNRKKVEAWVPKWLAFPVSSYTDRPFPTLIKWQAVEAAFKGRGAPLPLAKPLAPEATSDPLGPPQAEAVAAE